MPGLLRKSGTHTVLKLEIRNGFAAPRNRARIQLPRSMRDSRFYVTWPQTVGAVIRSWDIRCGVVSTPNNKACPSLAGQTW